MSENLDIQIGDKVRVLGRAGYKPWLSANRPERLSSKLHNSSYQTK